jgi:hypothetical protein
MGERQSCNRSLKRKKKKGSNISFVGEHDSRVVILFVVSLFYHLVLPRENAFGNGKVKEKKN